MKQKERHRLKENELAHSIAAARDFVGGPRRKQITGMLVVVVLIVAVVAGIFIIQQRTSARGKDLLADAMVIVDAPVQPPTPAMPPSGEKPGTMETQQPGTYPTEQAK